MESADPPQSVAVVLRTKGPLVSPCGPSSSPGLCRECEDDSSGPGSSKLGDGSRTGGRDGNGVCLRGPQDHLSKRDYMHNHCYLQTYGLGALAY